ncbi:MAG: hypothetical protein WCR74_14890 [Betaproteobacteria bacterium]
MKEPWKSIVGVLTLFVCTVMIALALPDTSTFDFWIGICAYTIALLVVVVWLT